VISRFASRIGELLRRFPRAVSGVFLFSLFMTFVYGPYDVLVKPFTQSLAQAEEVWFGLMLRGWAAKLTEPLHWLIYAGLSYGFYRERAWAWPRASLYTLQVALGMLIWSWIYASPLPGMKVVGAVVALLFAWVAAVVWRARPAASSAVSV
jgi:hypothetical protein